MTAYVAEIEERRRKRQACRQRNLQAHRLSELRCLDRVRPMARRRRYTDAFDVFVHNTRRAQAFLRVFDAVERGPGATTADDRQLLRGTVVLMIGTLDAFLHDLVLELVPTQASISDPLLETLREIGKRDPTLPLKMTRTTRGEADGLFVEALDHWISRHSFQGPGGLERALGIVGLRANWEELDEVTKCDTRQELEFFTRMRNEIVHRGANPPLRRSRAQDCVILTRDVASVINRNAVRLYSK